MAGGGELGGRRRVPLGEVFHLEGEAEQFSSEHQRALGRAAWGRGVRLGDRSSAERPLPTARPRASANAAIAGVGLLGFDGAYIVAALWAGRYLPPRRVGR